MSNARFIPAPEPEFGKVLLAKGNAASIEHTLHIATLAASATPRDMDQYADRVKDAQVELRTLARRLGYELVPAREKADA